MQPKQQPRLQRLARSLFLMLSALALSALLAACTGVGTTTPAAPTAAASTAVEQTPELSAAAPTDADAAASATVGAAPAEEATAAATTNATAPAATTAPVATEAAATEPAATEPPATEPAATPQDTATAVATEPATAVASPTAPVAAAPDIQNLRISLAPVASGLSAPLFVTYARPDDDRIFVVEKRGTIRILSGGQVAAQPFLDITDRVLSSGSEQGLLGLAFPPERDGSGDTAYFFVNYTDRNGDTAISRFQASANLTTADPNSEVKLLGIDQPAPNHNGGQLSFGPDGFLWIGMGDGGAANDRFGNGQNPQTLLGKMLRIDVTGTGEEPYTVPQDNPALAQDWNVSQEIWAIGLRNPWRYSFDRATGDLWIADVGQNQIEEVNVTRAPLQGGLNFGWPIMEGANCFSEANCSQEGLVLPVAQYEHRGNGCSVTGGYVYRGAQFPALAGVYLYGDYCSGRIWALDAANPDEPVVVAEAGAGLSSFGEDARGELYVTDLSKGTIRQIVVE